MDPLLTLILELYRAARETPVDEFQEFALSLVRAHTSFRSAQWGAGEITANGLIAHSVHWHNEPPEIRNEWADINRKDTVIDEVYARPCRTLISHSPSRYQAHGDGDVLDYTRRYGHMNIMVISTIRENSPGQWLSLYRPDENDQFNLGDGSLLEQIMPHLIEALEINRMLGQVPSVHVESGVAGIRAIARTDGTVYHCGKKFTDLMLEIWPDWKNGKLPSELMAAIRPNRETFLAEHGISVFTSVLGNMLFLKVERASSLHRLSRRELEVAKLYAQGVSYKEIGQLLNISPSTVRNFLGRIYTKLGINNKVGLVSLFSSGASTGG